MQVDKDVARGVEDEQPMAQIRHEVHPHGPLLLLNLLVALVLVILVVVLVVKVPIVRVETPVRLYALETAVIGVKTRVLR